ncbi:FecR family protein [Acinetobacter puyangensis]|uniref:FecR family protein n=1 Tax=Acinetobacter puyangensis TaxID=1096779 RepID=A0A240EB09_9GAMM|nr:FecR domain-containing protein [Acinetobacter puyangensis]SNX45884.1 FecR family protein [Acinetobacter puyangensis]
MPHQPTSNDLDQDQELAIAEMISDWLIQINSDDAVEQQSAQDAYQQWKTEHPQYLHIAQKLEMCFAQMQLIQQQPSSNKTVIQPLLQSKKKKTGKSRTTKYGLLLLAGFTPLALYFQQNTPTYLLADIRSKTGEWRTETLADGTQITLKNKTALNIHYSNDQRIIELVIGDILVNVAPDPSRPFSVLVDQGSIRALGTKFSVEYQIDHTDLIMLESKVLARSSKHPIKDGFVQERQVKAGERIYLTHDGIHTMPNVDIQNIEYEWKNQTLVAEEQSLTVVLDQLNQHHRGNIYYDKKKLANINVTAVVPLNNTENAMQLLQNALPQLSIKHIGGYIYWVDLSE